VYVDVTKLESVHSSNIAFDAQTQEKFCHFCSHPWYLQINALL